MSVTATVSSIIDKLYDGTLQPVTVTKSATYKSRATGSYNVSTGARTATETSTSINVIDRGTVSYVENGVEKQSAVYLAKPISGVTFTDTGNDTLTVDSLERLVVGVTPISLGSTDLLYELRVGALPVGSKRKVKTT